MTGEPTRVLMLRVAVTLAALFDVFAFMLLVRFTPVLFTLFMFVGELLVAVAILLLAVAIVADLRAKDLLPWGPDRPGASL